MNSHPMHDHEHHEGLGADLQAMARLRDRRRVLGLLAGVTFVPLLGCGGSETGVTTDDGGTTTTTTGTDAGTSTTTTPGSCAVIPEETAGPYPGDGSNGANTLTATGIVRSDITTSFGAMSGTAAGVPLKVELTLVNTNASCAPLVGYAFYIWHCDQVGDYSLYTVANQNYLRGIQATDSHGTVTFESIYPGCYPGRWPHIHFEIFTTLDAAAVVTNKVKTSQLALPKDVCDVVYATTGYEASVTNLSQISLATDMVFSDGSSLQVATVTGSVADGYVLTLTVGIAV